MIKNGQIVPSEITVGLLQKAMEESGKSVFLIDGFPRNDENRERFETQTGMMPKMVLFFDCSEEVMTARYVSGVDGLLLLLLVVVVALCCCTVSSLHAHSRCSI
jgi:UMP-CMP kinase